MTQTEAIIEIVREAMHHRLTKSGFGRACRALNVIGLDEQGKAKVLHELEYYDRDGKPYRWLIEASK